MSNLSETLPEVVHGWVAVVMDGKVQTANAALRIVGRNYVLVPGDMAVDPIILKATGWRSHIPINEKLFHPTEGEAILAVVEWAQNRADEATADLARRLDMLDFVVDTYEKYQKVMHGQCRNACES